MSPFFSVVIPTRNEEANIGKLLSSLAEQSFLDFEIIVSDSHSKDKTAEIVSSFEQKVPKLTFIDGKASNVAQARNNGARAALGNWLIFLDADVYVEKHYLKQMQKHILVDKPDMATSWNRPAGDSRRGAFMMALMNAAMTLVQGIKPGASGTCILMKKTLFEKIGGFDETIFFGEDTELTFRAAKKAHGIFRVYPTPKLYVSTRRFDKEGLLVSYYKSLYALFHLLFLGPVRKKIFEYEMGGQYYTASSVQPTTDSKNTKELHMRVKKEQSAGGIVYRPSLNPQTQGSREWLVTQHSQHKGWVFPKGLIGDVHIDEPMDTAALREVKEEGGVEAQIVNAEPVRVQYSYVWSNMRIDKTVFYFLMKYISGDPKNHDWEMMDAKFIPEEEVLPLLTYPSDKEAFLMILDKLKK
jgi:glycosyltransferase involved in cell wall biosynthesis